MRTIIALGSVGLTLALGGAAIARPVDRLAKPVVGSAVIECRSSAGEKKRNYYRHKKYYRHEQGQPRDQGSGASRVPRRRDQDGAGTARPDVRQPAVRARPLLGISA